MEVRIGIKHTPRELSFDTDASAEEIRGLVEQAAGSDAAFVTLADTKGRQYLVDVASVSYLELGGEGGRKVGFIS